jgi:hypothetical protein
MLNYRIIKTKVRIDKFADKTTEINQSEQQEKINIKIIMVLKSVEL